MPIIHVICDIRFVLLFQTTYADCCAIVEACEKNNVILAVGHVLRYTPQALKIKELVDSGAIGDLVNIQHTEPVCKTCTYIWKRI